MIIMAQMQRQWVQLVETSFRKVYKYRGNSNKIQWFPGHMMKGLRQMRHALLQTDCIIEVHDARIPFSGRNSTFKQDLVGSRPHLLVMNKRDLVFDRGSAAIEQRLREEILARENTLSDVIFTNCKNINCSGLQSVLPLTIDIITKSERFHRKFTPESNVLIIGIPNVGKSSLVNLIRNGELKVKGRALKVGPTPGVTRALQTKIRVSDDPLVFFLDTPGIMLPNIRSLEIGMKLAACATLKDENVGVLDIADYVLYQLNKNHAFEYVHHFGLDHPYDEILPFITDAAIKQDKYLTVSRKYVSDDEQSRVPDGMLIAEQFIRAFRRGHLGKVVLDLQLNDLLKKN